MKQKLPVKLLAIDLDHTLIGFGMVPMDPFDVEMIKTATQNKIEVVIVTGRSFERSLEYGKQLNLKYHTCYGGALVYDIKRQKPLFINCLSVKSATKIYHLIINDANLYAVFYTIDEKTSKNTGYELNNQNSAFVSYKIDSSKFLPFTEQILKHKIIRINVFTNNLLSLNHTYQQIGFLLDTKVNKNYQTVLEITSINGHKGKAVKALANYLKISQLNTMAIVDSLNDYSLIKYVQYAVAVANAHPLILKICQYQTKAYNQNGVGSAIQKWLLPPKI